MVTIQDEMNRNIIIVDDATAAEDFLTGLADRYTGLPGFSIERTFGQLIVKAKAIGEDWRILSTYTAKNDLNMTRITGF